LTPVLYKLVTDAALPLKSVETDFACDSSGFTTTQLVGLWQAAKYGGSRLRTEHNWLKAHIMCGTKTNIVTAIEITPRNSQDSPEFPLLVETTAANFNMQRVMGDKAYSSKANLELAESKGAVPFIPFKNYAVGTSKSETWNRLFHYFSLNRAEFLSVYHARSNAESVFSAIKRKFGDFIRSKTPTAQTNELLCKFLAYNIVCVVHAMFELGIEPSFCADSATRTRALR
jgi:transposase